MDLANVAKLGRRIADSIGITPALTEAEPHADADDEPERSAEPALELTLGRFLEQELDRVKERRRGIAGVLPHDRHRRF